MPSVISKPLKKSERYYFKGKRKIFFYLLASVLNNIFVIDKKYIAYMTIFD